MRVKSNHLLGIIAFHETTSTQSEKLKTACLHSFGTDLAHCLFARILEYCSKNCFLFPSTTLLLKIQCKTHYLSIFSTSDEDCRCAVNGQRQNLKIEFTHRK